MNALIHTIMENPAFIIQCDEITKVRIEQKVKSPSRDYFRVRTASGVGFIVPVSEVFKSRLQALKVLKEHDDDEPSEEQPYQLQALARRKGVV